MNSTLMPRTDRRSLPALGWLSLAALSGAALATLWMVARMYAVAGEAPPPVIAFAGLFALAAVAVAMRWRRAPYFGAAIGTLLLLIFGPHLPHVLAVPTDTVFAPAVLLVVFALLSSVTGVVAGRQNQRRSAEPRPIPRWISFKITAVGGLVSGIFLMAAVAQPSAANGIAPEILERLPAVEAQKFEFTQEEIRVRAGETVVLRLVNRDAASHSFDIDEFGVHVFMPPNETAIAIFEAGAPGTYTIYCAPHYDKKTGKGMKSTLIVEP